MYFSNMDVDQNFEGAYILSYNIWIISNNLFSSFYASRESLGGVVGINMWRLG